MQPDLILIPFAEDALPGNIDSIPESLGPSDPPQAASWRQGFPQVTMTPLAAGGIPPRGQSFNGVLHDISAQLVYIGGGGQYLFSPAFVAAKGGYPIGAVLQSDDGKTSYRSAVALNAKNFNTDPSSIGVEWIPYAGQGALPSSATESAAGIAEIATQPEVTAGTDDVRIVTPLKLRAAQATQPEAEAGTSNTKIMTPLRVRQAILAFGDTLNAARVDVPSAANINLTSSAPNTSNINITGNTSITGFTVAVGKLYFVRFDGVLTLTNGPNLVTQSGANITTAPGDTCVIRATAANVVEVLFYTPGIPQQLGYRQTYQNMLASRAINTTYTNNTSRTIWVTASINMAPGTGPILVLDGVSVANNANNGSGATILTFSFPVRPGGDYRINGGSSAAYWSELR